MAELYGQKWGDGLPPVIIEINCIQKGGKWKTRQGKQAGMGLEFHFRRLQELLWPEIVWHKWNLLNLQGYLNHRMICVIGPASSGKTHDAAVNVLTDYYCFYDRTTVLVSSTTRESLEMRIWGEIKKHHALAKSRYDFLPGNLIEGRQRIVTDEKSETAEGRDFRNGLVGVACKKGQNFQGLSEYAGIKNRRVRLVADELHFMQKGFLDSIANLNKNKDFKCVGLGNPKETMDPLGILGCPADHLGGWDSGIDQTSRTKTWETRYDQGICIQLPGSDSPNLDGQLGIPLISQKDIDADIKFYGKDSLQFTMMDEGRMPHGQGMRRVLTRNFVNRHQGMEEPMWKNSNLTKVGFMDAAYRGTGGDRCVFGELQFGTSTEGHQIMALIDTVVVPVRADDKMDPEDQIAEYVRIQCETRGIGPQNFFFDSTGRGTLVSAFARLWSPFVGCVEFGGLPSERQVSSNMDVMCRDYYSKFVSELWFSVRLVIESNQFRGMKDDVLEEFCFREWTMVAGHKVEVEPKDKTKIKTGRSPDLADALAAGVEGARRLGFVIEGLGSGHGRSDQKWKREFREAVKSAWQSADLSYR